MTVELGDNELSAVNDAYLAHIEALFKVLITNLAMTADEDHERDCVARFCAGIEIARRAVALVTERGTA